MRSPRLAALAALALTLGFAAPASADITAFLGFSPTSGTRAARGVAVGATFVIGGFEFEYSGLSEDIGKGAPSLRTGMFNGFLQTPVAVARMHFYATLGGGLYREQLGVNSETNLGMNVGGGVKVALVGPLRARFDYRVFKLGGSPINSQYHRFYAGANLSF